jgi:hypothetical protein
MCVARDFFRHPASNLFKRAHRAICTGPICAARGGRVKRSIAVIR